MHLIIWTSPPFTRQIDISRSRLRDTSNRKPNDRTLFMGVTLLAPSSSFSFVHLEEEEKWDHTASRLLDGCVAGSYRWGLDGTVQSVVHLDELYPMRMNFTASGQLVATVGGGMFQGMNRRYSRRLLHLMNGWVIHMMGWHWWIDGLSSRWILKLIDWW